MPTELAAPDSAIVADTAAGLVAAYVHIPFCHRVCPYCDFAVVEGAGGLVGPYTDALMAEIGTAEPFDGPLSAVFIGGGTPTAVPTWVLASVIRALEERFGLAPDAEVSVEANPEDVTGDVVDRLGAAGVTRVSLGVQSFDDGVLTSLGRVHTAHQALSAVETAAAVIPSVSLDLMFGTPHETPASWGLTVRRALDTGIGHLSLYALTVERGTPLSRDVSRGAPAPDPDDQAAKYEAAIAAATDAGFVRYETSNLARPGHPCTYNLVTWAQGEYEAVGNGAHRHRGGVRSWNVRRVDRYVEWVGARGSAVAGEERPGHWEREVERVMLGVRRAAGVVVGQAGRALLESPAGRRLVEAGVMTEAGGRLVVTRPLLGDEVARALLALDPIEC
jgi:putative oxygen-independent coproporphyrinogen III oxidase